MTHENRCTYREYRMSRTCKQLLRLKGNKKVSHVFILHAEIQKTNNFLVDDLLGPNDKPRTRGRKGAPVVASRLVPSI